MKRFAARATVFALSAALFVGCFPAGGRAALQPPVNYARSPTLETRAMWRTAVLPPTGTGSAADPNVSLTGLYDYAGMALMRTGKFTLVDRSEVDRLLQEQEFSWSGAADAGTAARLGKLLGAEAVMVVNVYRVVHDDFFADSPEQRDAELHVKIISVETAEVLYTAQGAGSDFEGASGALESALEVALVPLRAQ